MKIGVYDRWLHTLGGGERYVCALACALARRHEVEIVTHSGINRNEIEQRLGINLENARIVTVPLDFGYQSVMALSTKYDLFINASHGDMFPSLSKQGIQVVYFPRPHPAFRADRRQRLIDQLRGGKRVLASRALGSSAEIRMQTGFGDPVKLEGKHCRQMRAKGSLLIPYEGVGDLNIRLHLRDSRNSPAKGGVIGLRINGSELPERLAIGEKYESFDVTVGEHLLTGAAAGVLLELIHTCGDESDGSSLDAHDSLPLVDVAWIKLAQSRHWERALNLILRGDLWYVQNWHHSPPNPLSGYQQIWTISEYSRRWVTEYWGRSAEILFPPCEPVIGVQDNKDERLIVSVGRFFAGSHNKKHLPMIRAFRALCDAGLSGWQFHVVGGYDPNSAPEHVQYMAAVEREAEGYPVTIHKNASIEMLSELYCRARIFWHATGLDEDDVHSPEKLEHFGITTVEAMSAGCVPVVIAKGGQPEIVRHGIEGFLWETPEQLVEYTHLLTTDSGLCDQLSASARQRSQLFNGAAFEERLRQLMLPYESGEATT